MILFLILTSLSFCLTLLTFSRGFLFCRAVPFCRAVFFCRAILFCRQFFFVGQFFCRAILFVGGLRWYWRIDYFDRRQVPNLFFYLVDERDPSIKKRDVQITLLLYFQIFTFSSCLIVKISHYNVVLRGCICLNFTCDKKLFIYDFIMPK